MNRFVKFIWIMIIAIIVCFIICDEKWIEFERKNSRIIVHMPETDFSNTWRVELKPVAIYKNSDYIRINPEFENPKTLYKSLAIDKDSISKMEAEKESRIKSVSVWWDSVTSILSDYNETKNETIWTLAQRRRDRAARTWTTISAVKTEESDNRTRNTTPRTWISDRALNREIDTWNVITKTWNKFTNTRIIAAETWNTLTMTWNSETKTWDKKIRTWNNKINTWAVTLKTWNTTAKTWDLVETWNQITWKNTFTNSWTNFLEKEKKSPKKYKWESYEFPLGELRELPEAKNITEKYEWTHIDMNFGKLKKVEKIDDSTEKSEEKSIENTKNIAEKYEWRSYKFGLWKLEKIEQEENSDIKPDEKVEPEINTSNLKENTISNIVKNNNEENMEEIEEKIEEDIEKTEKMVENTEEKIENTEEEIENVVQEIEDSNEENEALLFYPEKYIWESIEFSLKKLVKIAQNKRIAEPYRRDYHIINIGKLEKIEQKSVDTWEVEGDQWFSEELLSSLLENEEIDVNTLESENDEFLQKIFKETWDPKIMNTILETYISEYQFTKAKKFVESLSETYFSQINPLLYLQICFNSFSLSSNTTSETLRWIISNYQSNWKITDDDAMRYEWVIYLMNKDYDKFFEISSWFTSQSHISLVSRLNDYKDQIKTQMWMPDYYFDTLVALELFNQWLFQPAKVISLSSLSKDPNYILPYQVLAYANFLTNSRDTSIEYLKKLTELDPDNVEKYRFLMWIAYYWNNEYEQSVLMLSQIRDDKLRLDTERYLIRDYIILEQRSKLISSWSKLLWYENLVSSDFYTYFYETFYHPYAEWKWFDLYLYDRDLADKMIRVCSMKLWREEQVVCDYWEIWKDIALWRFDSLEQSILNLVAEYPQWYLYQALWDYYIQQWDLEKAKVYLLKAISLTHEKSERSQIKKLLQDTM